MKPSDRIIEIQYALFNTPQFKDKPVFTATFAAIVQYLDEEYEKNKPCEHKSFYKVEGLDDVYYNVCNDCGVLFLANKD